MGSGCSFSGVDRTWGEVVLRHQYRCEVQGGEFGKLGSIGVVGSLIGVGATSGWMPARTRSRVRWIDRGRSRASADILLAVAFDFLTAHGLACLWRWAVATLVSTLDPREDDLLRLALCVELRAEPSRARSKGSRQPERGRRLRRARTAALSITTPSISRQVRTAGRRVANSMGTVSLSSVADPPSNPATMAYPGRYARVIGRRTASLAHRRPGLDV